MFTATNFTYDGKFSGDYGLKIMSFDANPQEETAYVVPTISTGKPTRSKRFFYEGMNYDNPPAYEFSVVSERPIAEESQQDILNWLDSRKGFRKLNIYQTGFTDFTYNCIFTVTSTIYQAGFCVGYNLSAQFDAPFQYGKPTTKAITGNTNDTNKFSIINKSDVIDDYVYPTVTINKAGGDRLTIINLTDNSLTKEDRKFQLIVPKDAESDGTGTPAISYYPIVIDNELKTFAQNIGVNSNLLGKFNKQWLRLLRGKNNLQILWETAVEGSDGSITYTPATDNNGSVTISCPYYKRIKF